MDGKSVGSLWMESLYGSCGWKVCTVPVDGKSVRFLWMESLYGPCGW